MFIRMLKFKKQIKNMSMQIFFFYSVFNMLMEETSFEKLIITGQK